MLQLDLNGLSNGDHGYTVDDDDDDDPILVDRQGVPVDTWRENYPYDERMSPSRLRDLQAAAAD
jgi:polyphosphate kinase